MTVVTAVPTKSWYKSKLFWLGVLQILGSVASYLADAIQTEATIGGIIFGVLTIIFRYVTKQPVTFTGKKVKSVER